MSRPTRLPAHGRLGDMYVYPKQPLMNPETDKQLASLIEAAKQTGSDVASFIQQQAPELCEQIVARKFYDSLLWSSWGVAIFLAGLAGAAVCYVLYKKEDDSGWAGIGFCSAFAGVLFGGLVFASNIGGAIEAKVAPKVVVAETITRMLKQ